MRLYPFPRERPEHRHLQEMGVRMMRDMSDNKITEIPEYVAEWPLWNYINELMDYVPDQDSL